jgi:two-component system CheB/CheR fusion protein
MTLRRAGWEVAVARTDHEALLALTRDAYDVLLVEADSPTGDGWRVLATLQGGRNATPVVVLLGQEDLSQQRAWELGASVVLSKPIGREALLAGIMEALANPSGNGAHPPTGEA